MNNPNPFLPQGAFLEQKNKARMRFKIAVSVSISLSVMVLMVLLIQGCKKPNDTVDTSSTSNAETNTTMSQLPTNPPDMGSSSNMAMTPPPETNPVVTPPPPQPVTPPPVASTEEYTIVKGDTFATIATKMNVKTKAIVDANPGVDAKKLKIGQKIHLPPAATSASTMSAPVTANTVDVAALGTAQTYKVKSGDTLTTIAKHFHVTIKAIQSANGLTTTGIKVGKVLKIPGSAAPASAPAPSESLPPPSLSAPTSAPAPTTLPPPTASHAPRS
jgi:LysM repeat protein